MWPGSLIVASDRVPQGGVLIFALMAAGGDFGASVGPQMVGVVTDLAMSNSTLMSVADSLNLSYEQFGMKLGMLVCMLFPLAGIWLYASLWRKTKKEREAKK